jgi:hypothetical protein
LLSLHQGYVTPISGKKEGNYSNIRKNQEVFGDSIGYIIGFYMMISLYARGQALRVEAYPTQLLTFTYHILTLNNILQQKSPQLHRIIYIWKHFNLQAFNLFNNNK